MKAHYKTPDGRIVFEVQAETPRELFRQLAALQEVFAAEEACGCCNATALYYRVRHVDGNDFFELVCAECSAAFSFGQHKNQVSLFPKRSVDGKALPNGGWKRYEKGAGK